MAKLLEDKNTKYSQEHLELEEKLQKSNFVKQQPEMYERQVHDLQNNKSETKLADRAYFECKNAQKKISTQYRDNSKVEIVTEKDFLKEIKDEMKCFQFINDGREFSDLTQTPRVMLPLPPSKQEDAEDEQFWVVWMFCFMVQNSTSLWIKICGWRNRLGLLTKTCELFPLSFISDCFKILSIPDNYHYLPCQEDGVNYELHWSWLPKLPLFLPHCDVIKKRRHIPFKGLFLKPEDFFLRLLWGSLGSAWGQHWLRHSRPEAFLKWTQKADPGLSWGLLYERLGLVSTICKIKNNEQQIRNEWNTCLLWSIRVT